MTLAGLQSMKDVSIVCASDVIFNLVQTLEVIKALDAKVYASESRACSEWLLNAKQKATYKTTQVMLDAFCADQRKESSLTDFLGAQVSPVLVI